MSLKDTQFTLLPIHTYALFQSISPCKDLQNVFEHCFFVIVTPLMKIVLLNEASIARKHKFGQRRAASTELMNRIIWNLLSPLKMVIFDWSKMHLFTELIWFTQPSWHSMRRCRILAHAHHIEPKAGRVSWRHTWRLWRTSFQRLIQRCSTTSQVSVGMDLVSAQNPVVVRWNIIHRGLISVSVLFQSDYSSRANGLILPLRVDEHRSRQHGSMSRVCPKARLHRGVSIFFSV